MSTLTLPPGLGLFRAIQVDTMAANARPLRSVMKRYDIGLVG